MGYKDTVMKRGLLCVPYGNEVDISRYLEAQAEISFKAGYEAHKAELCDNCDTPLLREGELYQMLNEAKRAGQQEVVEWIEKHKPYMAFHCESEWQAQLKKWGIKPRPSNVVGDTEL